MVVGGEEVCGMEVGGGGKCTCYNRRSMTVILRFPFANLPPDSFFKHLDYSRQVIKPPEKGAIGGGGVKMSREG